MVGCSRWIPTSSSSRCKRSSSARRVAVEGAGPGSGSRWSRKQSRDAGGRAAGAFLGSGVPGPGWAEVASGGGVGAATGRVWIRFSEVGLAQHRATGTLTGAHF
jgi:hypothetical protein